MNKISTKSFVKFNVEKTTEASIARGFRGLSRKPFAFFGALVITAVLLLGAGEAWGQRTISFTRKSDNYLQKNVESGTAASNTPSANDGSFTSNTTTGTGKGSWTVPVGVTKAKVHGIGGGGGGGGAFTGTRQYNRTAAAASGGGGGAYDYAIIPVTGGSSYYIFVGAYGSGGSGGSGTNQASNGNPGSASWFDSSSDPTDPPMKARGGLGGNAANLNITEKGDWKCYSGHTSVASQVSAVAKVHNGFYGGAGLAGSAQIKNTILGCADQQGATGGKGGYAGGYNSISFAGGQTAGNSIDVKSGSEEAKGGKKGTNYGGGGSGACAADFKQLSGTSYKYGTGGDGANGIVWIQYINATISKEQDVLCYDVPTGKIKIKMTAYGSGDTYKYKWTSSDNRKSGTSEDEWVSFSVNSNHEFIIDGLEGSEAGITYTVTVKEITSGCECEGTATITQPSELKFSQEVVYSRVSCHHNNSIPEGSYKYDDGMVTVYATGGTGDLTFTLGTTEYVDEEGEGHYQFTGLKAGTLQTYTVTVTDENNCSITNDQIKVPEPPELTFDTLSHRLVCEADGIIDVLNINGGTNKENSTGYTVRWDAQGGQGSGSATHLFIGDISGNDYYIQNITIPQKYDITVIDNNGCYATIQNVEIKDRKSPWPANWPEATQPQFTQTVCNETPFTITATDMGLQGVSNLYYSWTVTYPTGVTGTGSRNFKSSLTDTLINTTNAVQSVTYRVRALSGLYCYSDWFYVTVNVRPGSGTGVTFSLEDINNPAVCPGEEVTLSTTFSNVTSGMTAKWYFNGTLIAEDEDLEAGTEYSHPVTVNACATESYPYEVIVSNEMCSTNEVKHVYVNAGSLSIPTSEYDTARVSCITQVDAPSDEILAQNKFYLTCGSWRSADSAVIEGNPIISRRTYDNCKDTITYTYTYKACNDSTAIWKYFYLLEDNEAPEMDLEATNFPHLLDPDRENCTFYYPDVSDTVRHFLSDSCTSSDDLIIIQEPAAGRYISQTNEVQQLPIKITVKDNCGKQRVYEDNVKVRVPALLTAEAEVVHHRTCSDSHDGKVKVTVNGGTEPIDIVWDGDVTLNDAEWEDAPAGFHTVVVTDVNGCEYSSYATVEAPSAVQVTIVPTEQEVCPGTSVTLYANAMGGDPGSSGYSYEWYRGNTKINGQYLSSLTVNEAGVYTVTATDSKGCLNTNENNSSTLTFYTAITPVINGANAVCESSSLDKNTLTLTASPANSDPNNPEYTYVWTLGTNQNGTIVSSEGNQAVFSWSNPGANKTVALTVTDTHGCSFTAAQKTVSVNAAPEVAVAPLDTTVCSGASVTLKATTGFTKYFWNDVEGNFQKIVQEAGSYTVKVTDANGCQSAASASVAQTSGLTLSEVTSARVNVKCYGDHTGSVTLTAEGGTAPYTYSKDGELFVTSPVFPNLEAGTYTFTVKDFLECTQTIELTVNQPEAALTFAQNPVTVTAVTCHGGDNGSIEVAVLGGTTSYQYSNDGGASYQNTNIFNNLTQGSYYIMVRDANGCSVSMENSVTINEPAEVVITGHTATDVSCNGGNDGSITVTNVTGGNGNYQYSKNEGVTYQNEPTFNNLTAGTYRLKVKDGNGCVSEIYAVTIEENNALSLTFTQTNATCKGKNNGTVTLSAEGGAGTYKFKKGENGQWQEANTFGGLTAGIYTFYVQDAQNTTCTTSVQVIITEPEALAINLVSKTDENCHGESIGAITVAVTGGSSNYTYAWSHSNAAVSQMISGLEAGQYTVTVTDNADAACTKSATYTIDQPNQDLGITINPTNALCYGGTGSATITVTGGNVGIYHLTGAAGEQTNVNSPISVSDLSAGSYFITVTDVKGCQTSGTISISEPAPLQFENCPNNITKVCESGQNYAVATFDAPVANHNINNNNHIVIKVVYPNATDS